jgi:hypothetical protein
MSGLLGIQPIHFQVPSIRFHAGIEDLPEIVVQHKLLIVFNHSTVIAAR